MQIELLARIAQALERIADSLERGCGHPVETALDSRAAALAELRRALRAGELPLASNLIGDFQLDYPDAMEASGLAEELAEKTSAAIEDLRLRLAAARKANDVDGALTLRNELAPLLDFTDREVVDREILSWLMSVLMRRMRTGTVRADVALLAARVAEAFPHRPEGASIRASLPTLRRSAGLCAVCAEPYNGEEDACPKCLVKTPKIAELPETPDAST
jgi:hypothetical protein